MQGSLRETLVQESGGLGYVKGHELTSIKAVTAEITGRLGGDYTLVRELVKAGATPQMFSNTDLLKSLSNAHTLLHLAGEREKADSVAALLTEAAAEFVEARGKHTSAASAPRPPWDCGSVPISGSKLGTETVTSCATLLTVN